MANTDCVIVNAELTPTEVVRLVARFSDGQELEDRVVDLGDQVYAWIDQADGTAEPGEALWGGNYWISVTSRPRFGPADYQRQQAAARRLYDRLATGTSWGLKLLVADQVRSTRQPLGVSA